MILLLLLQIFNEVDWDCAAGFHAWDRDPGSLAEHRMETTNPPDMDSLLETAWQEISIAPFPFFHFPDRGKLLMFSKFSQPELRLLKRSSGPPPEELIPWRC